MNNLMVCLIGNLATGKTTTAEELHKHLPHFNYLSIDKFRQIYSDGTQEGEGISQRMFINDIPRHKNVILECSGTGKYFETYKHQFVKKGNARTITILLYAPIDELRIRLKKRLDNGYKPVPFPFLHSYEDSLRHIGNELRSSYPQLQIDTSKYNPMQATALIINYLWQVQSNQQMT